MFDLLSTDVEPLELWQKKLAAGSQLYTQNQPEIFHMLVAVRPSTTSDDSQNPEQPAQKSQLLGGLAFKYFEMTNCGFITHALLRNFEKPGNTTPEANTLLRTNPLHHILFTSLRLT